MTTPRPSSRTEHAVPYAVTAAGLLSGLCVLLFEPLPSPELNYVVGGAGLLAAVVAVGYMVIAHGNPADRGPDFD